MLEITCELRVDREQKAFVEQMLGDCTVILAMKLCRGIN